jgi:hypothetical protein
MATQLHIKYTTGWPSNCVFLKRFFLKKKSSGHLTMSFSRENLFFLNFTKSLPNIFIFILHYFLILTFLFFIF